MSKATLTLTAALALGLTACAANAAPVANSDASANAALTPDTAMCATPAQRDIVTEFFATRAGAPPPIAERALHMPEQVITSGLSDEFAVSASAENFHAVWTSAENWDGWVTHIIAKNGNHMKFPSPISHYRENTRGDAYYDVKPEERWLGMDAHFRPDLMTAIYAINLPGDDGRPGATRAVIFYDRSGESIVGLYATIAGEPQTEQRAAEFQATWDIIASLPTACPDGE